MVVGPRSLWSSASAGTMIGFVLFRGMTPADDGMPTVGRSGRSLGVRVPLDIQIDSEGRVYPATGGMSVAPDSMWHLPHHRRPRGMGRGSTGPAIDWVFSLSQVSNDLTVRPDPDRPTKHAFIEPAEIVPLETYETSIARTRPDWRRAWP
jgi:hypothetical protein